MKSTIEKIYSVKNGQVEQWNEGATIYAGQVPTAAMAASTAGADCFVVMALADGSRRTSQVTASGWGWDNLQWELVAVQPAQVPAASGQVPIFCSCKNLDTCLL